MPVEFESSVLDSTGAVSLRGNLHTHTQRSDGRSSPQEVIRHYAGLGHDFLALSDHDVAASYDGLDPCGMVLVPATEISAGGPHVLHVGCRQAVPHGTEVQDTLDAVAAESGFAVLCHPNWTEDFNHYPYELLRSLNGYAGVEIFNGVVIDHPGHHLATDKWDRVLGLGRRVWGFANDDAHRLETAGRGWNVVAAGDRTPEAIVEALREGRFYASCGVAIDEVSAEGSELIVRAAEASRISLFGQLGKRVHSVEGPELRFDASEVDTPYLRAECYGCGGATAWTQPIWVHGGLSDRIEANVRQLQANRLTALASDRLPELTGRADDPLWSRAEGSDNFRMIRTGLPPKVRTAMRCIVSGATLVFAFDCEEPNPADMRVNITEDGSKALWSDDSVEVFLDPGARALGYFHVMANAAGRCCVVPTGKLDCPAPDVTARAARTGTGWSVEVALRFGDRLPGGQEWRLHACRSRPKAGEAMIWAPVGSTNHNATEYRPLLVGQGGRGARRQAEGG